MVCAASWLWAAEAVPASEATISSDEMELIDNGSKTVFNGHVLLSRPPYEMKADKMTRVQADGVVEAEGNIIGLWKNPAGDKVKAVGHHARYSPQVQTLELWGDPRLTRWESPKDQTPLIVTADRFIAHNDTHMIQAETRVVFKRGMAFQAMSDHAQFDQTDGVLHLWGTRQVDTLWGDARGTGRFLSDRALLYQNPRRARLMDHVTGHIVPAP
jgi:lipopolysaccharide export system protein LptA